MASDRMDEMKTPIDQETLVAGADRAALTTALRQAEALGEQIAALQQQAAFEYALQRAAWQVVENLVGELQGDARAAAEAKVRGWMRELAPHPGNVVPVDVQLARHEQIGKVAGLVLATSAAASIARQERARFNVPAADALLKLSQVFAMLRERIERGEPVEVPAPDA